MRTMSGLVLDVYDDFSGATLRSLYPDFENIPVQVKEAQVLASADRDHLPDDVFALVLLNNGEKLRKYACIDEGNTALSVGYFLQNAHKLPAEAQKVAAENLKVACAWYGIEVPEVLEKVALGMNTAMSALMAGPVIKGTGQAIASNLAADKMLRGQGHALVTPDMRAQALGYKTAESSGTPLMPNQPPGDPSSGLKSKTVVSKTAAIPPVVNSPVLGKSPLKHPQAVAMNPTVDVSNKEPPVRVQEKKASAFALPAQQKYPLDSYEQVKAASAYFDTYVRHMAPSVRHEYAMNLVKRASDLALPVSATARKYGADDFAPEAEIKAAFDARRLEVVHDVGLLELLGEVEKVARFRMWKEASVDAPQVFTAPEVVVLLEEFDKVAGLAHHYDRTVPDPYYSVYGFEKAAEVVPFSEVIGNDYVTEADLRRLARAGASGLKRSFGQNFQEEFLKDPVGIFKSLPLDQKKMLMRMAGAVQPGESTV